MSLVVTRRTRARAAGRTDSGARSSSCRYRRDDTANTANAFSRLETHRGLPTGTIALRRRRARVVVFAFVGERAFGFASATSAFRCVRGSMFSLFSSSQLEYARCRGKALVFRRPRLPAFCGAHLPAASGPMSTFVAPWAGMRDGRYVRHSPRGQQRSNQARTVRARAWKTHGRLAGTSDAWARSRTGSARTKRRSRAFVRPSRHRSREQSRAKKTPSGNKTQQKRRCQE